MVKRTNDVLSNMHPGAKQSIATNYCRAVGLGTASDVVDRDGGLFLRRAKITRIERVTLHGRPHAGYRAERDGVVVEVFTSTGWSDATENLTVIEANPQMNYTWSRA
jgi:hypothetical protein